MQSQLVRIPGMLNAKSNLADKNQVLLILKPLFFYGRSCSSLKESNMTEYIEYVVLDCKLILPCSGKVYLLLKAICRNTGLFFIDF